MFAGPSPDRTAVLEERVVAHSPPTHATTDRCKGRKGRRDATRRDSATILYSYRNACTGSTRDARLAGIEPAASATSASTTVAAAITSGSRAVIPNNNDCAPFPIAYAPAAPTAAPTTVITATCRSTIATMLD